MTIAKLAGVALALTVSACGHAPRAQLGPVPTLELRESCERPDARSSCAPAAERPFVDTNMLAPPAANRSLAG